MTNEETSALQNMGAIPDNNILKCPSAARPPYQQEREDLALSQGL